MGKYKEAIDCVFEKGFLPSLLVILKSKCYNLFKV